MKECYYTGFCFQTNDTRMVEADFLPDGSVEADCCYGSCEYQGRCVIGCAIADELKK